MRVSHVASAALVLAASLVGQTARAADPTTADCLTASDSSINLRNAHKLRAARAQLLVCSASTCPSDIRKECARVVDEINSAIPTVVFEAKDAAGSDIVGVKVTMDGEILTERLEGTSVSLDPGAHAFTFESPGQTTVTNTIVIQEAQKDRHIDVMFPGVSGAAGTTVSGTTVGGTTEVQQPMNKTPDQDNHDNHDSHTGKRIAGFVFGGVGIALGLVALAEQVTALGHDNDSKNAANSPDLTVQSTVHDLHQQALESQDYAIAFGILSVASLTVGTILIATSGSSSRPSGTAATTTSGWQIIPEIGFSRQGLALRTTW